MQQAARLYELQRRRMKREGGGEARLYAIASGKGGVGKSNVTLNLGLALADLGLRVLLVDADWGLGKLDLLLGIKPSDGAGLWVRGDLAPSAALVAVDEDVDLLPAASGLGELARLPFETVRMALYRLLELSQNYDVILVDVGAGIGAQVQAIITGVGELLVVTTTEPPAVADAYAMVKTARHAQKEMRVRLIVNQASLEQGLETARGLNQVAQRFLGCEIEYLGHIPQDTSVVRAVRAQQPLWRFAPQAPASQAIRVLAARLAGRGVQEAEPRGGMRHWLDRLLERRRGSVG